jgi:tetratricopeptide (TPR) repeat protein
MAAELGVDYVLDGTVRWQDSADGTRKVRVTPQLVLAQDDRQIWTNTYDAVLADVFTVQSNIARQVAERLDLELLEPHRQKLTAPPTADVRAWESFLLAEEALERGRENQSREVMLEAIVLYEEARTRDPAFALALARLGEANAYLYFYSMDRSEERLQAAEAATTRALELDPDLAEAHYSRGLIRVSEGDSTAAMEEWELATRIRPNYAEAYWARSMSHTVSGNWQQAFDTAKKATELNPLAARHFCQLGGSSQGLGRYADALGYHERAIDVEPERSCPYYCQLEVHLSRGDLRRARRYIDELPAHIDLEENPAIAYYDVLLYAIDGQYERALARLATGAAEAYEAPWFYRPKSLWAAHLHSMTGDTSRARGEFAAAVAALEERVAARPFDVRVHSALANAYAGLDDAIETRREAETTLQLLPRLEGIAGPYVYRELARRHRRGPEAARTASGLLGLPAPGLPRDRPCSRASAARSAFQHSPREVLAPRRKSSLKPASPLRDRRAAASSCETGSSRSARRRNRAR